MKEMALATFVAERTDEQDSLEKDLFPTVADAIQHHPAAGWYDNLLSKVQETYLDVYHRGGGKGTPGDVNDFLSAIRENLDKTEEPDDNTVDRISTWLATAILNRSTVTQAEGDEEFSLEWVTMHDSDVRLAHREADGQRRKPGEAFSIDNTPMLYPGDTSAPIDLWINCRCSLRPVRADSVAAHVERWTTFNRSLRSEHFADSGDHDTSRVIVALPSEDHSVHQIGDEQKHMTLVWLGKEDENPDLDMAEVHAAVQRVASQGAQFTAQVKEVGELGDEGAQVWFTDDEMPSAARDNLLAEPVLAAGHEAVEQHPKFTPHVTIGYPDTDKTEAALDVDAAAEVNEITFDRLAVWHGDDQTEYPMGAAQEEDMPEDENVQSEQEAAGLIPWHGVLAPEGEWSGDGRKFTPDSLTHRDLPLPLTWQKATSGGHDGSVTVADICDMRRFGNLIVGWGWMLPIAEADEALGLMSHFGKYGVSVDADDAEMEYDEETDKVAFTKGRICSASIVSIPAFAQAFVKVGEPPTEWVEQGVVMTDAATENGSDDQALVAAAFIDKVREQFKRGPGWITNPEDTRRIHDYWTKPGEEGYAKIAWGTPGDFNRCRVEIGAKIAENSPEDVRFLNQICAQWHHDATGFWPGDAPAERAASLETPEGEPGPAVSLVASGGWCAPSEWFKNPEFKPGDGRMVQDKHGEWACPLTITEDGRVFGHLASWKSCHTAYEMCVAPPKSASDYAYFLTGTVNTDAGRIACGQLTYGGGHANGTLRPKAALAHYDSTSNVWADVSVGEDDYGIWYAGWVRPNASEETIDTVAAAGSVSGDWREFRKGELELIAVLSVNAPGFPVPRIGVADGEQVSLVAAGAVAQPDKKSALDMDVLAEKVVAAMERREERRAKLALLNERVNGAK